MRPVHAASAQRSKLQQKRETMNTSPGALVDDALTATACIARKLARLSGGVVWASMIPRLVAALLAVWSITCTPALAEPVKKAPKFKVGQRWEYKTRPGEEKSTLTILKLETEAEHAIVHIAIEDVHVVNPRADQGFASRVGHAPMAAAALARSVTKLRVSKGKLPEFQEGYDEWKKAHGGVFTITVAEALATVEASLK